MTTVTWKTVIKWTWILLVAGFVGYYAYSRQDLIAESLGRLGWPAVLGATIAIALAKIALAENMRLALRRTKVTIAFRDCFCIYNLSQIAKYVPGSIWQFVSRIAMLREREIALPAIRDSILAEHAWVLATALLFGVALVAFSDPAWLAGAADRLPVVESVVAAALAALIALVIALTSPGRRFLCWAWSLKPGVYAVFVLLVSWVLLGSAFWVTFLPFTEAPPHWLYFIGLYCLAYLAGFLAPFAPAGLGVREAVLVAGTGAILGADLAILLAAVNRVIYLFVESVWAGVCMASPRPAGH